MYAQPRVRLRDFFVKSSLDENYINGIFDLRIELKNHTNHKTKHSVTYEIFDDAGKNIASETKSVEIIDTTGTLNFKATIPSVKAWSFITYYERCFR
ncbi:MAG: hypothetical protein P8Y99_11435 [Calditrichaceae bacterium]